MQQNRQKQKTNFFLWMKVMKLHFTMYVANKQSKGSMSNFLGSILGRALPWSWVWKEKRITAFIWRQKKNDVLWTVFAYKCETFLSTKKTFFFVQSIILLFLAPKKGSRWKYVTSFSRSFVLKYDKLGKRLKLVANSTKELFLDFFTWGKLASGAWGLKCRFFFNFWSANQKKVAAADRKKKVNWFNSIYPSCY